MSKQSQVHVECQIRKSRFDLPTVEVEGMPIAAISRTELVDLVFESLDRGQGGWIVTANVDFLARAHRNREIRGLYLEAGIIVADGAPVVWAAHLLGVDLPERVAGADLVWSLAKRAAWLGRSLYLLGGDGNAAAEAAQVLASRWPALKIAGSSSPRVSSPVKASELEPIRDALIQAAPDIVYVALGSPKQEYLIRALQPCLSRTWMLGVGMSLGFVAQQVPRAPVWMQRAGLEWLHRLGREPRRLFSRYIIRDMPYAAAMLLRAASAPRQCLEPVAAKRRSRHRLVTQGIKERDDSHRDRRQ